VVQFSLYDNQSTLKNQQLALYILFLVAVESTWKYLLFDTLELS